MSHQTTSATDPGTARVVQTARQLDQWGEERSWIGSDPYDGGNARRFVTSLHKTPQGRRVVAQVVKRCPIDLRPALGVPPGLCSVTLANVVAAHALGGFLDPDLHLTRLSTAVSRLKALRLDAYDEPAWGYYWDAQSRVLYYPRTEPNGIATAFAAHALLDAYERLDDPECRDLALGATDWFVRHVPKTSASGGAFFGYLAGDRTPIHNANLLACSLLARAATVAGREQWLEMATEGVAYALAHQRDDGAWLYGETPSTQWIDGFHTGYVLDALEICRRHGVPLDIEPALLRGLEFYRSALFLDDGTPKYFDNAIYPIDAQSVAQGIQTFAIASRFDSRHLEQAGKIFDFAMRRMWRGEGRFLFQRRRFWVNAAPHMRWVQSPMLRALAHLAVARERLW